MSFISGKNITHNITTREYTETQKIYRNRQEWRIYITIVHVWHWQRNQLIIENTQFKGI